MPPLVIHAEWEPLNSRVPRRILAGDYPEKRGRILMLHRPNDVLEAVRENQPKLVVMCNLIGMGNDLAPRIREIAPETIIILYCTDLRHIHNADLTLEQRSETFDKICEVMTWDGLETATLQSLAEAFPFLQLVNPLRHNAAARPE